MGDFMSNVGEYLKKVRLDRNLSMGKVTKLTGIADSTLSNLENGKNKRSLSIDKIVKLASVYEINIIEFLINSGLIPASYAEQYVRVFSGTELLNSYEKQYVQEMINYIILSHNADERPTIKSQ